MPDLTIPYDACVVIVDGGAKYCQKCKIYYILMHRSTNVYST